MQARPTTIRYRTMAWLIVASALAYLCRNSIGVAESTVRQDLQLSLEQSGWFLGAFFWSYALFQVPCGWFAHLYGTRRALAIFAFTWSLACFCMGTADSLELLIAAQLLMGISQAGIFPAAVGSIGHWMPLSQRSLACGMLGAGMQVGAITASGLTGTLLTFMEWRWIFFLLAIPGLIWSGLFLIRFRDRPEQANGLNASELSLINQHRQEHIVEADAAGEKNEPVPTPAERVRLSAIFFICGQQICRASGYMFFASWFPTFLQETRGISIEASGYLQGLVLTGTMTGSLLGGMLTDWVWRRTGNLRLSRSGVGAMALTMCGLLVLSAWFVEQVSLAITLLTLGSLFAALAGPPTFATVIDVGGRRVPQLLGLVNMCGNLAAAACPILVGLLFEWTSNWNLVLLLFAIIYITGGICWSLVVPYAKQSTPKTTVASAARREALA
ncbi:MAG: MFS transporter [Rubinisphaera brasiliensis]|uniref:MFS transporter n=1 Tax=Rubinisphaera brasiliensis TaxID=119 RepID=UPI0039187AF7